MTETTLTSAVKSLGHGLAEFIPGSPAVPSTSETNGNVTVHTQGSEATPSFFEVSFTIGVELRNGDAQTYWPTTISVPLPADDPDLSYREIETEAAHLLPEALRSVAAEIEHALERAAAEST